MKSDLEELVTSVSSKLLGVTATNQRVEMERLLHQLVDYFEIDLSFLRHNDHGRHVTNLVAEWPPRPNVPDPDPLGEIAFAEADPTFAATETLTDVMIVQTKQEAGYADRVRQGSGIESLSAITVPLLDGPVTTGVFGLIKYGDRDWSAPEVNALRAVGALLSTLQGRVAAEERLRYLAYHDELTGLANRRALADRLLRQVKDQDGPLGVIFMDVDRLKAMNSFLGHTAGDAFLQALARRLAQTAGSQHLLARLGGDEFILALQAPTDLAKAYEIADRLRRAATEPVQVGGEGVSRAISVGVVVGRPMGGNVTELLDQADQAMLVAKARGGNEIVIFTEEMRRQNELRTDIELHLGAAIRSGSLVLYYQPLVDLADGAIRGLEALVRWRHPTLGLLQPNSFIEIAEATNLAGEMGRWVLAEGCRQLADWQRRFLLPGLGLSVNISPAQLITTDFIETVAQTLAEYELDGSHLTMEITEHAVVGDRDRALNTLMELKEIGVRVAIDDFGTGYSSLAQLKSLPVDILKIDQGFIRELGESTGDLAIVRSIVGLATSFGLQLEAEGVETAAAAEALLKLGVRRAQGYLFARPLSAEDLEPLLVAGAVPALKSLQTPTG